MNLYTVSFTKSLRIRVGPLVLPVAGTNPSPSTCKAEHQMKKFISEFREQSQESLYLTRTLSASKLTFRRSSASSLWIHMSQLGLPN